MYLKETSASMSDIKIIIDRDIYVLFFYKFHLMDHRGHLIYVSRRKLFQIWFMTFWIIIIKKKATEIRFYQYWYGVWNIESWHTFFKSAEVMGGVINKPTNKITCTVDINNNLEIIMVAPCMVIQKIDHSAKGNTYIKRDNIMVLYKCEYEGSPPEQKICMVWELYICLLLIKFSLHKLIA